MRIKENVIGGIMFFPRTFLCVFYFDSIGIKVDKKNKLENVKGKIYFVVIVCRNEIMMK